MDLWIKMTSYWTTCILFVMTCLFRECNFEALPLNSDNINNILANNELVFVNFYADWCRYSQILKPIFDETATKMKSTFPEEGKVVLAKVDCDKENAIAAAYHVSKYPTLKIFRNGNLIKREYRGQRSVEAFSSFLQDQLKDPVIRLNHMNELDSLNRKKRNVIGYFDSEDNDEFRTFSKSARLLREDCIFHAAIGEMSQQERVSGNRMAFRPHSEEEGDVPFTGQLRDENAVHPWLQENCVPLVREITFENAEELTEEGLPFLILFHHPDDTESPEKYRKLVAKDLLGEKSTVNFLTADGLKFSHPLYHLGKSSGDLPVLAIDSFRHMYIFPHDVKSQIETLGLVKQFIADLHSGKLHREFHHGPDPTPKVAELEGDNKDGDDQKEGDDSAVGTPKAEVEGTAHVHAHVQQQLIMTGEGVALKVVRVVKVGEQGPLNLQEQMQQIENAIKDHVANGQEAVFEDEDEEAAEEDNEDAEEGEDEDGSEQVKKEDGKEKDRDINPKGKVLQQTEEKEEEKTDPVVEETKEETQEIPEEEIEEEHITETKNEPPSRIKEVEEVEDRSADKDNNEDYDVVHSRTKKKKVPTATLR